MKWMKTVKKIIVNMNLVCSLILLTIQVLDWYNPYMDFMGHAMWILYALCVGTIALGLLVVFEPEPHKQRKRN